MERLPRRLADSRYVLLDVLGEGGMAVVYRARDEGLSIERAIKVLDPGLTSGPLRRRFVLEAQTMAGLDHPNLVTVHDVHADDPVFLVMELMAGSVHRWLGNHGPMPPRMAVQVTRAVLQGLAYAHARGIVHRDVKPQNILVSPGGTAKLTDFGIARVASARTRTRTGAVMGTYAYMPPEQRASAKHVDHRADIYAIGATLYALVTNDEPTDLFASESHALRFEGVPEQLRSVIVAACRYEPGDRFADAEAMDKALAVVTAELPDVPEDTPQLWRCGPARRHTTIDDEEHSFDQPRAAETWQPRAGSDTLPEAHTTDVPITAAPESAPRGPLLAGLALLIGVSGVAAWNWSQSPEPITVVVEELPVETTEVVLDEPEPPEIAEVVEIVEIPPAVAAVEPVVIEEVIEPVSTDPGRLVVNTIPNGKVKVDDGARRPAPWQGELSPGDHVVVMEAYDGRPPKTVTLPVPPGGELVYCWDFNREDRCAGSP